MARDYKRIRAAIIRGGTSKGVYLMDNELPSDPDIRENVILSLYGSPDIRQIDGLGGADPLTSKVAVIKPSLRKDADVDYTFGQVSIDQAHIDYRSNCGNISSGVGPYAVDEGMVQAVEPITVVRIYNTNTDKIIEAEIPVADGKALTTGDCYIPGVPNPGAKIMLNFVNSGGAITGKILPTGQEKDIFQLKNGKRIIVSIVDASTPAVFVKARDIGISGSEPPHDIENNPRLLVLLEDIRAEAALRLKFVPTKKEAATRSQSIPKVIIVSERQSYQGLGTAVDKSHIDFTARAMAMGKVHKAFAVTGGICTSTAALIEGTVVHDVSSHQETGDIRIGHPSGTMDFSVTVEWNNGEYHVTRSAVPRTSRRLMDGLAYVPAPVFEGKPKPSDAAVKSYEKF
ncbi:2-methylaconitate cis-trans isomerase PrpF family protein [Salibacterium aidingense]|uniref:2-methylaconitate cis-trans isomerase PrpF family protein n=1 Tax=Salibacterium aidingense TaxID=384933 RepID=UPI00041D2A20|nr:PrpF domain-containing protein [Salibacterium aidingense]